MLRSLVGSEMCIRDRVGRVFIDYISNFYSLFWLLFIQSIIILCIDYFTKSNVIIRRLKNSYEKVKKGITKILINYKNIRIYICYSTVDEEYLNQLKNHLANLEGKGKIVTWDRSKIITGITIEEYERNLNKCKFCLLYTSPSPRDS